MAQRHESIDERIATATRELLNCIEAVQAAHDSALPNASAFRRKMERVGAHLARAYIEVGSARAALARSDGR